MLHLSGAAPGAAVNEGALTAASLFQGHAPLILQP